MSFRTLNAESARSANNNQSGLNAAGKYVGALVIAEYVQNQAKGSSGINYTFKSKDGQQARWYSNLTYRKDGQQVDKESGWAELDSLMACFQLRELADPTMGNVEKYDKASGQNKTHTVPLLTQLMNKPIGALFRMEEYENDSGDVKEKPLFDTWFDPASEKVASEILDGQKCTEPKKLGIRMEFIAANPVKRLKGSKGNGAVPTPPGRQQSSGVPAYIDDDDSIPF